MRRRSVNGTSFIPHIRNQHIPQALPASVCTCQHNTPLCMPGVLRVCAPCGMQHKQCKILEMQQAAAQRLRAAGCYSTAAAVGPWAPPRPWQPGRTLRGGMPGPAPTSACRMSSTAGRLAAALAVRPLQSACLFMARVSAEHSLAVSRKAPPAGRENSLIYRNRWHHWARQSCKQGPAAHSSVAWMSAEHSQRCSRKALSAGLCERPAYTAVDRAGQSCKQGLAQHAHVAQHLTSASQSQWLDELSDKKAW